MKAFYQKKLITDLMKDSVNKSEKNIHDGLVACNDENAPTILVVDDEPSTLELLSIMLCENGFNVVTASSVKQARNSLKLHPETWLIICDLRMPDEDGFALIKYLKTNSQYKFIPIVISSSCANEEVVKQAISMGAVEYINKPYSKEVILARINNIIDAARCKILLVSDDSVVPPILGRALGQGKYIIITAESGKKALEKLMENKIDVIISELALVDMTGLDFMTQVCSLKKWVPIIFLGDQQLQVSEVDIISAGGHGLISRPFKNVEVSRKIEKLFCAQREK